MNQNTPERTHWVQEHLDEVRQHRGLYAVIGGIVVAGTGLALTEIAHGNIIGAVDWFGAAIVGVGGVGVVAHRHNTQEAQDEI